jgi:hypothetical protein
MRAVRNERASAIASATPSSTAPLQAAENRAGVEVLEAHRSFRHADGSTTRVRKERLEVLDEPFEVAVVHARASEPGMLENRERPLGVEIGEQLSYKSSGPLPPSRQRRIGPGILQPFRNPPRSSWQ